MFHPFTQHLLDWYMTYHRELPWRNTRDPYAIWVCEVIMQQTRIRQGIDYWFRFMERFPNVHALAAATEDEVLTMWQGLGYYRRALNMLIAARQIDISGSFPNTVEGLLKLRGVGDYIAAAVGSIAFGLPVPAIDGNAYRVLARCFGIDTPIDTALGKSVFTALATQLLPHEFPGEFNQAMMDFGAMCCTPHGSLCHHCPFMDICVALHTGRVDELPVKSRRPTVRERRMTYICVLCNGYIAMRRRPMGDIWQGLWEPLLVEGENPELPDLDCPLTLLAHDVRHVLTHRVILADFYLAKPKTRPALLPDYIWVAEQDISNYAVSRLVEKLLEQALTAR